MELDRAHAILGIDASTPLRDVRAAYLARAKLLHPDWIHGNEQRVEHRVRDPGTLCEGPTWDGLLLAGVDISVRGLLYRARMRQITSQKELEELHAAAGLIYTTSPGGALAATCPR